MPATARPTAFCWTRTWECWRLILVCDVGQLIVGVFLSFITELHKFPVKLRGSLHNLSRKYCSNKHTHLNRTLYFTHFVLLSAYPKPSPSLDCSRAGPSMGAGSSLFTGSRGRASSVGGAARVRPIAVYKPSQALNLDAAAPCEVVTPTKRPPKERARQYGKQELGSGALPGNGHTAALLHRQDSSTSRASTARSPTSSPRRGKTQTGG
jgi:hypothetical protein